MSIKYNDKTNNREILLAGISPVDQILNGTSKNAIANKAVFNALKEKIEKTVSDLVNYYSKSDVYNKAEVRALISTISTMDIQVVNALPTEDISTTTIYFLKPAGATTYDEYVYINNAWVKIGTTDLDLSQYVTNDSLTLTLSDYYSKDEITTLLTQYVQKDNVYDKDAVDALLNDKQDVLTFDNVPTEDSANVVKSGGVYSAVDDVYKVMGENGAKNLIPYPHSGKTETKAGITFTENADGSVTVNGTATEISRHLISSQQFEVGKKYILSGCPNGGGHGSNGTYTLYTQSINNYDDGESVEFEWNASITGITIAVFAGVTVNNLTFYPMLRLASDTDSTYQPYALTNQELTNAKYLASSANTILGAKNFFVYPYRETTKTTNGITFTDLGDGRIQCDGTATAMTTFALCSRTVGLIPETYLPNGEYILSSGTEGGDGSTTYEIQLGIQKDGAYQQVAWTRNGGQQKFTIDGDDNNTDKAKMDSAIIIRSGVTVSNLIFKPLIRLVGDGDDAWAPYAKTNQQLTKDTTGLINNDFANGAVNILPPVFSSTVKNGVTFTVNSDGSVTANGTASDSIMYNINNPFTLETGKTYKWTGCPRGGTRSTATNPTYKTLLAVYYSDNTNTIVNDYGDGVKFTVSDKIITRWEVRIDIFNGYTCNNVVFKPMITTADMPNSDYNHYVPYAMTNRELTEKITNTYQFVEDTVISTNSSSFATCMTDIVDLLSDYQATCSSNEFFKIQIVNCNGILMTLQLPIDISPTTDLSSSNLLVFSSVVIHANDLQINAIRNNVTDGLHRYTLDNTTLSWTHTVLNSTNTITIMIRVYKYRKV